MEKDEVLTASLVEFMSIEEAAFLCRVEEAWLSCRVKEGYFIEREEGFSSHDLKRAKRMSDVERNFDAAPELAALVADLLEEIDRLKTRT